jgi:hypothetical protein
MEPEVELCEEFFSVIQAKENLDRAIKNVPFYLGQYSSADFYQIEAEEYVRNCKVFVEKLRKIISK